MNWNAVYTVTKENKEMNIFELNPAVLLLYCLAYFTVFIMSIIWVKSEEDSFLWFVTTLVTVSVAVSAIISIIRMIALTL